MKIPPVNMKHKSGLLTQGRQRTMPMCLRLILLIVSVAISPRAEDLVPLKLKLPDPAFVGTPKDIPAGSTVEPASDKPRPPLMVPSDVTNLTAGKSVIASDTNAPPSALKKIIDGQKDATEANTVLLRKGTQYVQFDLGSENEIFAIVIWHAHDIPKVYHDVVVQLSDTRDFKDAVSTVFNNDQDNSSGLGIGTDREYFESNEGKLIAVKGAKAHYVRLYSHGSTDSALNEYTEVEIYGRPAK